jgi:hypothetical protein
MKISNRIGFTFPAIIVLLGLVGILFSLIVMIHHPILGALILIAASFFSLSSYGSEIDTTNEKFREYGSMFGVKRGKWEDLSGMPFIGIFKSKSGYLIYSRTTISTTHFDNQYEVCLMSPSHRRRVVLQRFKTKNDALNFAHFLENRIDSKLTEYNPRQGENVKYRRR